MFQIIKNSLSFISPSHEVSEQSKELYQLLNSEETEKTSEFIQNHPELINSPLPQTSFTPFEFSVAQKKAEPIQQLLLLGANANQPNSYGISGLDNLLLIKNKDLITKVFGNALGTLLNDAQEQADSSKTWIFDYAQEQLSSLKAEIKKYSDLSSLRKDLKELANAVDIDDFETLDAAIKDAPKVKVFNLALYSLFTHKNNVLEKIYKAIGKEFLDLTTTDLKNWYTLAAIADNSNAIELFHEWGFSSQPGYLISEENRFSPYHYAILSPSFKTFLTLLKVGVPMPPSAPLQKVKSKLEAKGMFNQLPLNPIQLLVYKAALIDPLPKTGYFEAFYLLTEAVALFLQLNKKLDPYHEMILGLVRTLYFLDRNIIEPFLNLAKIQGLKPFLFLCVYNLSLKFKASDILRILPPTVLVSYLKYATYILSLKSAVNSFSSLYQSYSYRPWKSVLTFVKETFTHFLYFKHAHFDENKAWTNLEECVSNNGCTWRNNVSTLKNPLQEMSSETYEKIKKHIKTISYQDLLSCSKISSLRRTFSCIFKPQNYYISFQTPIYNLPENIKFFREQLKVLLKNVHPDKTGPGSSHYKEILSLCNESKCENLWNKYFISSKTESILDVSFWENLWDKYLTISNSGSTILEASFWKKLWNPDPIDFDYELFLQSCRKKSCAEIADFFSQSMNKVSVKINALRAELQMLINS